MGWNPLRTRRERQLREAEEWRAARRIAGEDVTAFGEELTRLHEETLADPLDEAMRRDYQLALDLYDAAERDLASSTTAGEVAAVDEVLDEGRFHLACVLARRDGVVLPQRRDPCFFNPQHGPAVADVVWAPPAGVERKVAVCRRDRDRLTQGEEPDVRLVRVGDRHLPWWQAKGPNAQDGLVAHVHDGLGSISRQHAAEATTRSTLGRGGGGGGLFGP